MRRKGNSPKFSCPLMLASFLTTIGVLILIAVGSYWLSHAGVRSDSSLWRMKLSWWLLGGIGTLSTASAVLFFSNENRVRWMSPLQKCIILALLGHLALMILTSVTDVGPGLSVPTASRLTAINLKPASEVQVAMSIRRQLTDLPSVQNPSVAAPKPVEVPPSEKKAEAKAPPLAAPKAQAKEQPLDMHAPKAQPALQAEKSPQTPAEPQKQSPTLRKMAERKPLTQREAAAAPQDSTKPRSPVEVQKPVSDPRKPDVQAKPAEAKGQPVSLAARPKRAETENPVSLQPTSPDKQQLKTSPQAAGGTIVQAEQQPNVSRIDPKDARLAKEAASRSSAHDVQLRVDRTAPSEASLSQAAKTQQRIPDPAKGVPANAQAVQPIPGRQIAAAPANVPNASVRQTTEATPGATSSARFESKLASTPAGKSSARELEAPVQATARPTAQAAGSLAAAAEMQQHVGQAAERPSAPAQPIVEGRLEAKPTSPPNQAISQAEARAVTSSAVVVASRLGGAASPAANRGNIRLPVPRAADVSGESLTIAARVPDKQAVGGTAAPQAAVPVQGQVTAGQVGAAPDSRHQAPIAQSEYRPTGSESQEAPTDVRFASGGTGSGQTRTVEVATGPTEAGSSYSLATAAGVSRPAAAPVGRAPSSERGQTISMAQLAVEGFAREAQVGRPVSQQEAGVDSAQVGASEARLAASSPRSGAGQARFEASAGPSDRRPSQSMAAAAALRQAPAAAEQRALAASGSNQSHVAAAASDRLQVTGPQQELTSRKVVSEQGDTPGSIRGSADSGVVLEKQETGSTQATGQGPAVDVKAATAATVQEQQSMAAPAAKSSRVQQSQEEPAAPAGATSPVERPELEQVTDTVVVSRGAEPSAEARVSQEVPHAARLSAAESQGGPDAAKLSNVQKFTQPAEAGTSGSLAELAVASGARIRDMSAAADAEGPRSAVRALPVEVDPKALTMPKWLVHRSPEKRQKLVEKMGGSRSTEEAVARALEFLARSQEPDGQWAYFTGAPQPGRNPRYSREMALTGLAALCFLASDHTPAKPGPYQRCVTNAIDFIISQQKADGDLRGSGGTMYDHGMASLAVAEAAIMTGDKRYRAAAIKAAAFIIDAQDPATGGWRYDPRQAGDTSVFGWQIMALYSIQHLGLKLPKETLDGASRWLDRVSSRTPQRALAGYQDNNPAPAMTAEAAFCRILLARPLNKEQEQEASQYLISFEPGKAKDNVWGRDNFYLWYYTALVLMQMQNEAWRTWNVQMRDYLLKIQLQDGPLQGSWEPNTLYSRLGGRVYSTAIATLTLEVYYRYLPIYDRSRN